LAASRVAGLACGQDRLDQRHAGLLRGGKRPALEICQRLPRPLPAFERKLDFGKCDPILRATALGGNGCDTISIAAHLGDGLCRRRHPLECLSRRQEEQHLFAVVGVDDDDLARRLADRSDGSFALPHFDAALRIAQLDDALENVERGLVALDRHRPIGAADRRCRRRRLNPYARPAAFRACPDGTGLKLQHSVSTGAGGDLLDDERGVAAEPDLRPVGKQDRQLTGRIGA
jgi:hypothetical protein